MSISRRAGMHDELVPPHLNAAALAEMENDAIEAMRRGPDATLDKAWPRNDGIRAVCSLPTSVTWRRSIHPTSPASG